MKEIWKKVKWCSDYEVSNLGNVRSWRPYGASKENRTIPKLIKPWISNGYEMVTLSVKQNKKSFAVHTLVAESFIGLRPEKHVVCHKDDNKTNNKVNNLYYGTYSQNGKDAIRNKKLKNGEDHPSAKLLNADIDTIRHLVISLGMTHKAVADIFNVSKSTISEIINSGRRK